jgi:hypothetical protein
MKRIRFTLQELDLIIDMICIADANAVPEGDYFGWDTDNKYQTMDLLTYKVAELRRRLLKRNASGKANARPVERAL